MLQKPKNEKLIKFLYSRTSTMAASPSPSLLERAQDFVSEHRRAVLIATAAAVVAVGGVAYYASTSRQPTRRTDLEKGEKKDRKKGRKKTSPKPSQGPILEERKPKAQAERMSALSTLTLFSQLTHLTVDVESLTAEEIASKSEKVSLLGSFPAWTKPTVTGANGHCEYLQTKGQRSLQDYKTLRGRGLLHQGHTNITEPGAYVFQQPRGLLRQHVTSPARQSHSRL